MAIRRDESYYFFYATFEVEGTLFRVPRKEFEEQSVVFRSMISLSLSNNDEHPIRLDGVTSDDFRTFLSALYPRYTIIETPLTEKELDIALALARLWCFDELRAILVDKLASLGLTPARKLELARIHDIRSWYRLELNILARRTKPLAEEEIRKIGTDSAFMVLRLKERRLAVAMNSFVPCAYRHYAMEDIYVSTIEQKNGELLKVKLDSLMDDFAEAHKWDDKR